MFYNYDWQIPDPDWALVDTGGEKGIRWKLDEMAFVTVAMHQDQASENKALIKGRREFLNISGVLPKEIKKVSIEGAQKFTLFTTVQVEYTVQIIASKKAIKAYYNNNI